MDGEPLIKLPVKDVQLVRLEFSEEERDIYNLLEARQRNKFNRYLREGTVLKYVNRSTTLVPSNHHLQKLSPSSSAVASPSPMLFTSFLGAGERCSLCWAR